MNKKFIAPGKWFSFLYPSTWYEFEDQERVFLFYNPSQWTGNFRISAYKGKGQFYGEEALLEEAQVNSKATWKKIGKWRTLYSQEQFIQEGETYVSHAWMMGEKDMVIDISFTTLKGASIREAEQIITTLKLKEKNVKSEIIPIRVQEIAMLNEAFSWMTSLAKKKLSKELKGEEADLQWLQQLIDKSYLSLDKPWICAYLSAIIGIIITNEVENVEWVTLVKGSEEQPVLRLHNSERIVILKHELLKKLTKKETFKFSSFYKECIQAL